VAEVSRKVLGWRLRMMPTLYTAFYDSHMHGCPIARPLFFVFPSDSGTLGLREQWMMGVVPPQS
jgi:alpha-glucosidase (family GH31 glycosyl hydrolase)